MLHSETALKVGVAVGCEFVLFDSPLIDFSALVVSRVGRRYSARFQAGPLSEFLIEEAIDRGLAAGGASVLSVNEVCGHKVMRIAGGLNAGLGKDFMHALTRTGVDRIDLAAVTKIDAEGSELCRIAVDEYRVGILRASPGVCAALRGRVTQAVQKIIDASEMEND